MTRAEAKEWYECYQGKEGKKGADIFQGAARDLMEFLALLQHRPKDKVPGPVELVQLGDLNDFWIGMKCGFDWGPLHLRAAASSLVEFWHEQVRESPRVGPAVKLLEELACTCSDLPTTLLYGNHDNYFGKRGSPRPAEYKSDDETVWAEHGHQSDSFNSDDNPVLGWALTQAAFLFPKVRDWEDPLSAAIARMKRVITIAAWPTRLERMARAADVCYQQRKLIYVMAHTHRPCIRKITTRRHLDRTKVCEHEYQCVGAEAEEQVAHVVALAEAKGKAAEEAVRRKIAHDLQLARSKLRRAGDALGRAGKWLRDLPENVKNDLQDQAAEIERQMEQALGIPRL